MSVSVKEITALKDLASKDVLVAMGGVAGGLVVGEYFSELARTAIAQSGWPGFGVKAGVKALIALLMGVVSKGQTGLIKVFLTLTSIGSLASIIPDLIGMVYPGGSVAGGQITGLMLRELALGSEALAVEGAGVTPTAPGVEQAGVIEDYAGDSITAPPMAVAEIRRVTDFAGV